MDALTSLKKGKDAVFDFVGRISRSVSHFAFAVTAYLYLNVLLLGLSSHPRIACRTFDIIKSFGAENPNATNSWDNFVKFVLNDCKVACALCSFMLMTITLVSAATYHSDPITCQINLVAVLPPAFGMAQVFCIMWHLKSTSKYPNAPFHWKKVTAYNARSPFIKTTALLAAPIAWVAWSMISFIMILFVILFRGLPIPPFSGSEGSLGASNWIIETFNLIFTYGVDGTDDALVHLSVASRVCAAAILTIGCVHLAITVLYFTRLCLPQEVPSAQDVLKISSTDSPLQSPSCSSSYSLPYSPSYSSSYSTPPSFTPTIATEGLSPTELFSPPKLAVLTSASYPASSTPSPSPESGLFMSPLADYFSSTTSTLYSTSPIMTSPQAGEPPPRVADGTRPPPRAVLRGTPVTTRPHPVPF